MFDAGFDFSLIQRNILKNKDCISEYIFQFKTSEKKRYIATVEEYTNKIFVPKFYPSKERNNPNRFSVLTNEYKSSRIIRTVINIMLLMYKEIPDASFAWIGVATSMKNKKEGKSFTQRYRIYKTVMLNFFNEENWFHYDDYITSTYLLINKRQKNVDIFLKNAIRMFTDIYPDLERLE